MLDAVAGGSSARPALWDWDAHFPDGHYYDLELLRQKLKNKSTAPLVARLKHWQKLHFASAHIFGFPFDNAEDCTFADTRQLEEPLHRDGTELKQFFTMLRAGPRSSQDKLQEDAMA